MMEDVNVVTCVDRYIKGDIGGNQEDVLRMACCPLVLERWEP